MSYDPYSILTHCEACHDYPCTCDKYSDPEELAAEGKMTDAHLKSRIDEILCLATYEAVTIRARALINEAVAEEREACARVADQVSDDIEGDVASKTVADTIAKQIRRRWGKR